MNLKEHVEQELNLLLEYESKMRKDLSIEQLEKEAEQFNNMTPQEYINQYIVRIMEPLYDVDISAGSLSYLFDVCYRLSQMQNLSPLTLDDSEFMKIATDNDSNDIYQNKRNCLVFKTEKDGIYHIDGQEFLDMACGKFKEVDNETNKVETKEPEQLSIFDLGVEDVKENK